jgi:hypothetical protein
MIVSQQTRAGWSKSRGAVQKWFKEKQLLTVIYRTVSVMEYINTHRLYAIGLVFTISMSCVLSYIEKGSKFWLPENKWIKICELSIWFVK